MSHFREMLDPTSINTPLTILTGVGLFLTGGDGGLFRFANLWGCAAVMFASSMSSGFEYPIGDRETSAKLGFAAGLMYAGLTEMRVMRPVLPRPYRLGVGGFYMVFHGARYIQEVTRFEDAGED